VEVAREFRDALYLHVYLAGIAWWRLAPAPERIRNQPSQWMRKMAFAQSSAGDLAVAYLLDNEEIQLDLSGFPAPLPGRWFNPPSSAFSEHQVTLGNAGVATIRQKAAEVIWTHALHELDGF